MSPNHVRWVVWCAFVTLLAGRGSAAREPWHAAEQRDLEQALERAPLLQTESLGEPARGVNVWERWMVPNLDGKSWDVLQSYFKEYYGPTWLYVFDLGTGQMNVHRRQLIMIVFVAKVTAVLAQAVAAGQSHDNTIAPASNGSASPWSQPVRLSGSGPTVKSHLLTGALSAIMATAVVQVMPQRVDQLEVNRLIVRDELIVRAHATIRL